jgi:hypothetical protein
MLETVEIHLVMWIVMLESAKDRILGVDTQDNRYRHMFSMEWLAYYLWMLWKVYLARMSGNWCSYSSGPTRCKWGYGTPTTPGNLSNAMVPGTTLAKPGI